MTVSLEKDPKLARALHQTRMIGENYRFAYPLRLRGQIELRQGSMVRVQRRRTKEFKTRIIPLPPLMRVPR